MPAEGWTDSDIKTLRDAIEYHGKLSNRIIDDLADGLHRTPEAVKAKVRQIKLKDRAISSGIKQLKAPKEVAEPAPVEPQSPATSEAVETQEPAVAQPSAPTERKKAVARKKETASYMDLVECLAQLDELTRVASSLETEAAQKKEEAEAARRRVADKQSELALRFPGAKSLLDRFCAKR